MSICISIDQMIPISQDTNLTVGMSKSSPVTLWFFGTSMGLHHFLPCHLDSPLKIETPCDISTYLKSSSVLTADFVEGLVTLVLN